MIITECAENGLNWLYDQNKSSFGFIKPAAEKLGQFNKIFYANDLGASARTKASITGLVATIGSTILGYFNLTSASMFIGGSALLTGTLTFTAVTITHDIINKLMSQVISDQNKRHNFSFAVGVVATAGVFYMASVPIVISIGLTTLGFCVSRGFDKYVGKNINPIGGRIFQAVEAGFIYSLASKFFNWIRPGLTVGGGSAVKTALLIMSAISVDNVCRKNRSTGLTGAINQAVLSIGSIAVAWYYSPVALVHQLMIYMLCVAETRLKD